MSGTACRKGYPLPNYPVPEENVCDELWRNAEIAMDSQPRRRKELFQSAVMIQVTENNRGRRLVQECFRTSLYDDKGYCETLDSVDQNIQWGICSPACDWIGDDNPDVRQFDVKTLLLKTYCGL